MESRSDINIELAYLKGRYSGIPNIIKYEDNKGCGLMSGNRILSIYGSKEDCFAISKEKKKTFPGIYLDTTVIANNPSLRRVCSEQKKRYPLKKS